MSFPILYKSNETKFDHNGFGILSDCISCEVVENTDGVFELSMQYPIDGIHFKKIKAGCILKVITDTVRKPQLFRIYFVSKTMQKTSKILARHISYDLNWIPVRPFSVGSLQNFHYSATEIFSSIQENVVLDCPYTFYTDIPDYASGIYTSNGTTVKSILMGDKNSVKSKFGGNYYFDNFDVKLLKKRGKNSNFSIKYGKNLTDMKQEENCADVFTAVYPFWYGEVNEEKTLVELPEKIIYADGTYDFTKVKILDFSKSTESPPSVNNMRSSTQNYIKNNNIGIPVVSLTVSFVQLAQWSGYEHLRQFENIGLYDIVNVDFFEMGVSANAQVSETVFDCIAERIKSISLGKAVTNIADTIANLQKTQSQV